MKSIIEINLELLEKIKQLEKQYVNDQELGSKIRKLLSNNIQIK